MTNLTEFYVRWQKVEIGLRMAQIDEEGILFLRRKFDGMLREYAEAVLEGGSSAAFNRSAELETNRHLFRAFNLIAALRAERSGLHYSTNVAKRDQFWGGEAQRAELEVLVKTEYRHLRTETDISDAPSARPRIPVQLDASPFAIPTRPRPPARQIRDFDAPSHFSRNVLPELRNRTEVKFVKIGLAEAESRDSKRDARSAWFRAKADIAGTFADSQLDHVFRFGGLISEVDESFAFVRDVIKANNQDMKKTLDLASKLLTALIPDVPPFKYFAKAIEAGMGLVTIGDYNPHQKFVALRGGDASKFSKDLADVLQAYNSATSLSNLDSLSTAGEFKDTLSAISRALLTEMREVTRRVLDCTFGTDAKPELFDLFYSRFLARGGAGGRAGSGDALFIHQHLEPLKSHIKDVLESHLVYQWNGDQQQVLGARLRMGMVCAYLVEVFKGSTVGTQFNVNEQIVTFLASTASWGILMLDAPRANSEQRLRLNWKGDEIDKEALLLFCRWYVMNINPFHILVNGPAGAKRIQERCEQQILIINQAMNRARVGRFWGGESWDLKKMWAAYEGLCAGAGVVDWVTIDEMVDA